MEYVGEALVFVGVVGEVYAEWDEPERKRLAKVSSLVLIVGLALSLAALIGTNENFNGTIAVLNSQAAESNKEAGKANDRAAKAEEHSKQLDQSTQQLKTAAEEAHREAEDERLARIELEERVAWRSLSPADIKAIGGRLRKHKNVPRIAIAELADNEECVSFAQDIAAVVTAAHWPLIGPAAMGNLGEQRFGLMITTTRDVESDSAAHALAEELKRFSPQVVEQDQTFNGGGNGIYVFVELRPRLVPARSKMQTTIPGSLKVGDLPKP